MAKLTPEGLKLIKEFEGLKLEAYKDVVGIWTIGYGTTAKAKVGITPKQGMRITEEEAEMYLKRYLDREGEAMLQYVKVYIDDHMYSALLSFVYNVGIGAFRKSTLLKKLNAEDYKGAAEEFLRWNKAGGKVFPGLTRRRKAERSMFLKGVTEPRRAPVEAQPAPPSGTPSGNPLSGLLEALSAFLVSLTEMFSRKGDPSRRKK